MAPVEKRLTMEAANSTSSIGTGLRPSDSAERMRNMPRMVMSCSDWSFTCLANERYLSGRLPRTACCRSATTLARQTWDSPRTRKLYSPPTSSALSSTGTSPKAAWCRSTVSCAISRKPMPSICVCVPVKYFLTKLVRRPTASKICAPQ